VRFSLPLGTVIVAESLPPRPSLLVNFGFVKTNAHVDFSPVSEYFKDIVWSNLCCEDCNLSRRFDTLIVVSTQRSCYTRVPTLLHLVSPNNDINEFIKAYGDREIQTLA
jgi:hypothetical protein